MAAKYTTDIGSIIIDDEVIAKTAGMAALDCYGVVGMASTNVKDGLVQLLLGDSLTKGIKVSSDGDAVSIEFHIIVEYGISISEVCKTIVETVRYKLESMTGVKVRKVGISVEGIRT